MRTILVLTLATLIACKGDNKSALTPDAGEMSSTAKCGNAVIEEGEDCDDGNLVLDGICDSGCHFTCGNGTFDDSVGETCDTAITGGTAGMCPTACDDNDACTSDVLSGSECTTMCLSSVITAAQDGDGCCPAGANANSDNDCTAMCGNGVLETGELCDTGITAGAGACPMVCNDGQSCTTDTLISASSCQAHCTATPITTAVNGDGCCPTGATSATDNDCSPVCGNGVVDAGETCDTAITTGAAGRCPTTCSDGVACTSDVLTNAGTCTAACTFPAITQPANNDGCCPAGANANNDNNCSPMCGNGVREGTEQCDDGNQNNTDTCRNNCTSTIVPTAFRFNTLALRDPHAFANVFGCNDITDSFFGNAVNQQFANNLSMDADNDGDLDLSPTLVFRPLTQGGVATSPLEIHFASCTPPANMTMCSPGMDPPIMLTATNQSSGTCLSVLPNTTHPYTPAITQSSSPCFVSTQTTVTVALGGVNIVLHDAKIAATYVGNPASQVTNGLLRGFVTEADANATIFPSNLQVVGGKPFSSILPGGAGNCRPANQSDKDVNNGVSGWWFYLNFTAPRTTWSDN